MYPDPPHLPRRKWRTGEVGKASSDLSRKHAFCPVVIPGQHQDMGQGNLYTCPYHLHTRHHSL